MGKNNLLQKTTTILVLLATKVGEEFMPTIDGEDEKPDLPRPEPVPIALPV